MEFRLLGPVEAVVAGRPLAIGHARQRSVLAVLLLELGRAVPAERLIDRVWGEDPPVSVRNVLYGYLSRLKTALAGAGDPRVALTRRSGGYLLQADPEQLDTCRFQRLAAQAVTADDDNASALLRNALGLWHGQALAGLDSPWLRGMREALEQQRIAAVLDLGDIALRLGLHGELVRTLAEEAAGYPVDERLTGQLMLALYRSGRQAEALRKYEQIRNRLADELGADPGPALHALYQQILTADTSLTLAAAPGDSPVPHELPADAPAFTGRAAELAELDRLLTGRCAAVVISGTAGIGKTALAVRWAHQAAGRFPGGQLHVNLRGYDPAQPVSATDALAGFLRSLGVPGQDIPPEQDERAARYRSLLAARQMLVVLDNASSADQVRPLLPGKPTCAVVVTSRDMLAGLVARDGACRLDLDVLPLAEAVALLRTLIGARVDTEPRAAAELAIQCCRLPLALRVAAELAASRPAASLAALTGELADLSTRLDLLGAGQDPHTEVRTVFSWSCHHLDTDTARTFRLLGLHPGPDLDSFAAAALTGATVPQARRALDLLARAHLLAATAPDRYGMHDLLRGYARELTGTLDTGQDQHAALTRLFDYYLHTAAIAMDTLFPAERHYRPGIAPAATPVPPLPEPATAGKWLDGERAVLVTVAEHAAGRGWPAHATRLASILASYLRGGGHFPDALAVFGHALGAARRTGDRIAEATALKETGNVHGQQGRFQQAGDHHRLALALFRAAGDRVGEGYAVGNIGLVEAELGRYEQAARHHQEAVAIFRDIGDRFGEARALGNLGQARRLQGHYQEATGYFQQTLNLFREVGDHQRQAITLGRLGTVDLRQGRYQHAALHLQQAVSLYREMSNTSGQAESLFRLGEAYLGLGNHDQAATDFGQALATSRQIGNRALEADALNGLGEVAYLRGDPYEARAHHVVALQLASEVGAPDKQARAHSGLARTWQASGDLPQARHHWQEALTRYEAIGAPEAGEIRAQLAQLSRAESTEEHRL